MGLSGFLTAQRVCSGGECDRVVVSNIVNQWPLCVSLCLPRPSWWNTLDNPKSDKECVSDVLPVSASLYLFPRTIIRAWWREGADSPHCAAPACRPGGEPTSFAPSKNNTHSHFCCLISAFLLYSLLLKSDQSKLHNLFDLTWFKLLLRCTTYFCVWKPLSLFYGVSFMSLLVSIPILPVQHFGLIIVLTHLQNIPAPGRHSCLIDRSNTAGLSKVVLTHFVHVASTEWKHLSPGTVRLARKAVELQ